MRQRLYEKDKQTFFAKEHYNLKRLWLTDVDATHFKSEDENGIIITENKIYMQYKNLNTGLKLVRFVEVKNQPSKYINELIEGKREPNAQTIVYCNSAYEMNGFRSDNEQKAKFTFIVETYGNYPMDVYDVTMNDEKKITFNYEAKLNNKEDYIKYFSQ